MFTAMFLDHYSRLDKAKAAAEAAEVIYVDELLQDFGFSIKTISTSDLEYIFKNVPSYKIFG